MSVYSWDRPKDRASAHLHRQIDAARYRTTYEKGRATAVARLCAAEADGDAAECVTAQQLVAERDKQVGDHLGAALRLDAALTTDGLLDGLRGSAHLSRCSLRIRVGDAEGARSDVHLALRHSQLAGSPSVASGALVQSGLLHLAAGNHSAALDELDHAFSLGRENSLAGPKGQALALVGCVYERQGLHNKALQAWDRARLLHERSADSAALGRTYNNVGVLHFVEGRFQRARSRSSSAH